jgi:uncharacterized protein YfaS (alpha-2-macroglobulin family)
MRRLTLLVTLLAAVGLYAAAFSAETPMGALRGRILVADTGQPLAGISVVARPTSPRNGSDSLDAKTDKDGVFQIRRVPVGGYEVEPQANVYENKGQAVTVREGEAASVELKLKPNDPYLTLYIHQHAYLPGESPKISLNGFREGDGLRLRILSVDDATLLRDYGSQLRALLTPVSRTGKPGAFRMLSSQKLRTVKEWPVQVRKRDAEGVFYHDERLGALQAGIYLVEAASEKAETVGWVMVTDLALVTKSARGRLVAYTADLRTGKPVAGAQLTVFSGDAAAARATTDTRGLADLRPGKGADEQAEALAVRGKSVAFTRFYLAGNGEGHRYRVFTYTDRPVYRPGHRIRFKGVARLPQGAGYAVPSARSVEVEAKDDQDTTVYHEAVSMNERGTFAGELMLPSEARTGTYALNVKVDGEEHSGGFTVASYRKPEWKVDVKMPRPRYVRGERVPVTVRAEYYFGSPVANAKVNYTVYRSPYWSWGGEDEDAADPEYEDTSGDVVVTGETTTNADGAAQFEFATDTKAGETLSGDYQYTVQADVTDLSERSANGSGKVRVSPGELTVDARPSAYVASPGDEVTVKARVRDFEDHPAAGAALRAVATLQVWDGKQERQQPLAAQSLRADEKGEAEFPIQMSGAGLVTVKVDVTDRRGNRIDTSTDVWVTTATGGDYPAKYPSLSVIPDKKLYRIGETAQVLVNTDRPGATALVAVEAEGILDLREVPLNRRSTVVRFPIKAGYEPDVFVSACFVRSREFVTSEARLNVNAEAHRLQVTVESDREVYHPGETATFRIRTTDAAGRPKPAELSFGVVDEAVYAIREEPRQALWDAFYPRRRNEVATQFSFPDIYLGDADKAGSNVAVRKNFPDMAYWDPFLRTDAGGRATVRVPLPDSLTSWRATAAGQTLQTEVGKATRNIRVTRDLTLRLQTPRSLNEGDRLTLSAVAHNFSSNALDAAIELKATGATLRGEARKSVHLNPNEAQSITWEVGVDTPGTAKFTATAVAGTLSDGMELTVPVRPFTKETVQYRTGALSDNSAQEDFTVDPGAAGGSVELRVSPTLAGTLLGSLDYLATYPYGCTEQTMSSFLPNVVVSSTLKSLGIRRPELEAKLPAMTEAGLFRLYRYQHPEGGWGWWEYDETDPWMTAYVVFGMTLAREAGVKVNEKIYKSGVSSANEMAADKKLTGDQALFLAYALTRARETEHLRELLKRLDTDRKKLQVRSLGYAALALAGTGEPADRLRAQTLLEDLWRMADTTDGLTHWTEPARDHDYGAPQDVESTAVVLKAALALAPEDPRVTEVVRWLLLHRHGERWESTRDTAWILFALTDYLKGTGELRPDYHFSVLLNGKELHAADVKPGDALQPETVVRIPLKGLPGANRVEVRRAGTGTVYYSLKVLEEIRAPAFAAESSRAGLTVRRDYFRLETRRDASGRIVTGPEKNPTAGVRIGDRLMARLRVHTDRAMDYVMLEDPLPAGFEVQDRGDLPVEEWSFWWSHSDVRDDRVLYFARRLEPGDHVIEYYLRPEMTGTVRALPAVLSDMYAPATRASTAESRLEVGR